MGALHEERAGSRRQERQGVVSAFIATAFVQETPEAANQQWRALADQIRPKPPKLPTLMDAAESDVLAYMTFPREHRTMAPLDQPDRASQRRNQAQDRRRRHLPQRGPQSRLVGAILMEQSHERAVRRARYTTLETIAPVSDNPIIVLSAVPGT
ncbi:transposase [Novosphingobium sp. MMS21-SN21R]|nr:transposase [Novosphingobium sp. MMS21-SN21R]MDT0510269.1 transposase [Novosphingobium sp. MMS21-SN21R]